jgi:hypothetical protein
MSLPSQSGSTLYWPGWDVFDAVAFDPVSGIGVDVNAAYLDGSGDTLSTFRGPNMKLILVGGGREQSSITVLGTSGKRALSFQAGSAPMLTLKLRRRGPVTVLITQKHHGRLVGQRCRSSARRGRRCTVIRLLASTTVAGTRGTDRVPLPIGRLRPGRYTATVVEHLGRRDKRISFAFTIK